MPIKERINDILRIRHKNADILQGQLQKIKSAKEASEKVSGIKASVLENGQLNAGSPLAGLFANNPDAMIALKNLSADVFILRADKLIEDYEALYKRFSREFINIAFVGDAGVGKSATLQAITGLDSNTIPSFSGNHVTGTASIIENVEKIVDEEGHDRDVCAELSFKTTVELLNEVNTELNVICGNLIRVNSLADIKRLTEEMLTEKLEEHYANDGLNRNLALEPLRSFCARFLCLPDLPYRDRFQNHSKDWQDEWMKWIDHDPIILYEPEKIISFVAQHNDPRDDRNYMEYHNFIAVKQGVIKTKFRVADVGQIKLIDTEGLGNSSVETRNKMMRTIKSESDAVILEEKPKDNNRTAISDKHTILYTSLNTEFEKLGSEYWLGVLLNIVASGENANEKACQVYADAIPKRMKCACVKTACALDPDDINNNFLIPFLDKFSENLKEIDQLYIDYIRKDAEAAYVEYELLREQMKKIISAQVTGGSTQNLVYRWGYRLYDDTTGKLKSLVETFAERRNDPCEKIHNKLSSITKDMLSGNYLPTVEKLEEYEGGENLQKRLQDILNADRNEITKQFIGVDVDLGEVIDAAKDQIATCLLETGKLDMLMPELSEQNVRPFRRLETIAQEKLDANRYPQLRSAIEDMANYELSIRGSLLYNVRSELEEFSMRNENLGNNIDFNVPTSKKAQQLHDGLWGFLGRMQGKLNAVIKNYDATPSKAIYALCDEFYDRVTYSQDVKNEWHDLHNDYQTLIWMDELMEQANQTQALNTWREYVDEFDRCKGKDNFVLESIAIEP